VKRHHRSQGRPPPDPVVVELGRGGWGLITIAKHPEVHRLLDAQAADRYKRRANVAIVSSAAITACHLAGTPLTYEPGTRGAACVTCIERGGGHA
jgi:23S rRNA-/tRNA-specific pseudouridylate synthase